MRTSLLLLATIAGATAAYAADGTYSFQLAEEPGNPVSCMGLANAFDRPFVLTVAGGKATLESTGGVHVDMTSPAPDQYKGAFDLAGERLDFTADVGAAKTLSARGNNLGCKWSGKAS